MSWSFGWDIRVVCLHFRRRISANLKMNQCFFLVLFVHRVYVIKEDRKNFLIKNTFQKDQPHFMSVIHGVKNWHQNKHTIKNEGFFFGFAENINHLWLFPYRILPTSRKNSRNNLPKSQLGAKRISGKPRYFGPGPKNKLKLVLDCDNFTLDFCLLKEEGQSLWKISLPKKIKNIDRQKFYPFVCLYCKDSWARFHWCDDAY